MDDLFPIGTPILGGRWTITEQLFGSEDRGLFRAQGECRALVTMGTTQTGGVDRSVTQLRWASPGITPLLAVGSVPVPGGSLDVLVEAEPDGVPLRSWSGDYPSKLRLAAQAARIVRDAEERAIVLGSLRPDLIYAEGDRITGIAPRTQRFQENMLVPSYGIPVCFESVYFAPAQAAARPPGPPADVFSLAATLAFLFTGQDPFEGDSLMEQLANVLGGRHRPLDAAGALAPLLAEMLRVDGGERPSIAAVVEAIERELSAGRR